MKNAAHCDCRTQNIRKNNWQSKCDQLIRKREAYSAFSERITFLELEDNAAWEGVRQ